MPDNNTSVFLESRKSQKYRLMIDDIRYYWHSCVEMGASSGHTMRWGSAGSRKQAKGIWSPRFRQDSNSFLKKKKSNASSKAFAPTNIPRGNCKKKKKWENVCCDNAQEKRCWVRKVYV